METTKKYISLIVTLFILLVSAYAFYLKNTINVAYLADNKYIPYVMTSIYSLIKHKTITERYNIYVIAENFTAEDVKKIKILERTNVKIFVIDAKEKYLNYSNLGRFITFKITLQKIFLPTYLEKLNKVLYLDSDTIIQKNIQELYSKDISTVYVAASKDGLMFEYPNHITEIGLNWRNFYFNSGVMLLNLKKMRNDNILSKSVSYFHSHTEIFGDQDILNVVVRNKFLPISYTYNLISNFFEKNNAKFLTDFYQEKVFDTPKENYDNATILHFSGTKPWKEEYTQPYLKSLWYKYHKEMIEKYNLSF